MERERFKSIWNGTALIIFFAGIFLGFEFSDIGGPISGFSTFGVAIFMWIIGGTVTNMIYGPKDNPKRKRKPPPRTHQANLQPSGERVGRR